MPIDGATAAARHRASDDDALVRLAAAGDATAFDTLIATRLDRCHRVAFSILGDASDAADATQDACVLAWRDLPRLRNRALFDPWLNRIVANAARMSRRHRTRLRETPVSTTLPSGDGHDLAAELADPRAGQAIDSVATSDAIGRAFDRLRERERLILVLHHVEERPLAEIATSLGLPVGTVKSRLSRARAALHSAIVAERAA